MSRLEEVKIEIDKMNDRAKRGKPIISPVSPNDLRWLYQQAKKQDIMQITEKINGGGICPRCSVRLIGKANYCGKCGQAIGWRCYDNE